MKTGRPPAAGEISSFIPAASSYAGLRTNTRLMATLCPQQAPGRESSMLPPTSSSAAPPVAQGQSPGCAGDTGDAQQSWSGCRKTALQLSTHRIPSYHFFRGAGLGWGGGGGGEVLSLKCQWKLFSRQPVYNFRSWVQLRSHSRLETWRLRGFTRATLPPLCCASEKPHQLLSGLMQTDVAVSIQLPPHK